MPQHTGAIRWLILGGACLVTTAFYAEGLSSYFLGDDLGFLNYIADRVRSDQIISLLFNEILSPPDRGGFFYRPFVVFSFVGDYLIWGTNPIGWHITNLLLHFANTLLLWRFVEHLAGRELGQTSLVVGGAAAAIFALRPCSPETVIWLSARNDAMVLLGFLIALLAYLHANAKWGCHYLIALSGFLFALGSKEAGVTLPAGLLSLHIAGVIALKQRVGEPRWKAWFRHTLIGIGPFALVLLAYLIWRLVLFGSPFKVYLNMPPIDFNDPAWQAAKLHGLRFFLAPSPKSTFLGALFFIVTSAQVLIGLLTAGHSISARRVFVFGICWLMAMLLPLAQQLFIAPTGEGARLLYIPGAALAVLLSAPLAGGFKPAGDRKGFDRYRSFAAVAGIMMLIFLSVPLLKNLLRPWLEAGRSMGALPAAIAVRAEAIPEGGLAILLIPDQFEGALFGRNGQGALLEPPVQKQVLGKRVLVVTPLTLGQFAPPMALSFHGAPRLEQWCWNLEAHRFERLILSAHDPASWRTAWKLALQESGCLTLAHEVAIPSD
jgi:protein O-mannosyl-transferase